MENSIKEKNTRPNLIVFARQTFTPLQKGLGPLSPSQLETGLNVQPNIPFITKEPVTVSAKMLSEVSEKKYSGLKQECKELAQKVLEISDDENEEFEFIVPFQNCGGGCADAGEHGAPVCCGDARPVGYGD